MTTREWIALASFALAFCGAMGGVIAFFLTREKALWAHVNRLRTDLAVLQNIIDRAPDWGAKFEKLDDKIDSIGTRIDHLVVILNSSFMSCPNHQSVARPQVVVG